MTHPTDTLRLVPNRDDGHRVGRAILEAHSQWEKEHGVTGAQNPWQEQHIILLGQAAILAAPASPPAYVRTPNEDDRLRRALYRLLERHGAGPDILSVIGSLWDTLDQGECTDLIEDWLITGKTIHAEGDIDEMLASIPEEVPASPLPEGGGWQDISTAPKDGALILCFYADRYGHDATSLRYWTQGDWPSSGRTEGWCDQHRQLRKTEPTHWMPLPAAPTGEPK